MFNGCTNLKQIKGMGSIWSGLSEQEKANIVNTSSNANGGIFFAQNVFYGTGFAKLDFAPFNQTATDSVGTLTLPNLPNTPYQFNNSFANMTNLAEVDFSNFKTANNTIAENSSGTTLDNLPSFHTNTNLTFDGCSSLTSVNGVENMGTNVFKNNMFQNCTSLTEIDFSKATGLTAIPNNMFQGCTSLTTVKGMDKLTNLTVIND